MWNSGIREMKEENKRENKNISKINSRKAVRLAAFMLFLVFVLHFIMPAGYELADNGKVETDLKNLNKYIATLDKEQINSEIDRACFNIKLKQVGGNKGKLDNRFVFSNSVLVGDSMAEGIVDYRILDASNVFAKRGKSLSTSDDLFKQAVSASPENLFIEFGMNDIIAYRGKEKPFISQYKGIIRDLKKKLPNTKIYIVSISTISPLGIKNTPSMGNFRGYNLAMKKMCK